MSIEMGDRGPFDIPDIGPVVGSEFAEVTVDVDNEGNSPRLRLRTCAPDACATSTRSSSKPSSGCPRDT